MTARYALYFAPARHSPWWAFGAHWLGRDECSDQVLEPPSLASLAAAQFAALTAQPRRYGFHATLKAPFRLGQPHRLDTLLQRVHVLAAGLKPVALGPLQPVILDQFVALVPHSVPPELERLAQTCVVALDDLRAPLSEQDLARRGVENLDPRALELLHRYGYPHVLERFRLHFSLSGPVPEQQALHLVQAATTPVERLNATHTLVLDRLCLFAEPAPGQAFRRLADVELPA